MTNAATSSLALRKPGSVAGVPLPIRNAPRPQLQLVPTFQKRRITWPMWLTVAAMLVAALVVPVVINTQLAMTSYDMYAMQNELNLLLDQQADLVTQAREAQSPQYLAEKAREIGLVPAGEQGYVTLSTREIIPGKAAH